MSPNGESILEIGSGLFGTHVHLEDVQEVIGEQMNTGAKLGPNTELTVVGDGNGFLSRVILVEPEWTVPDDHLPSSFILKISSCQHIQGLVEKMKTSKMLSEEQAAKLWETFEVQTHGLHNREVNLYSIIEKWNNNDVMLNPKIYFFKKFSSGNKTKAFLGMELVPDVTIRHLYANAKPHELHPVLKSLAHLQARSLHLTDEERESITGFNSKEMRGNIMTWEGICGIYEQTKKINRERLEERVGKVKALGPEVINFEIADSLNKYVGIEHDVLVHGDLWAANILWKETDGVFSVSKVIDYQLIHMGNPAEDLVRLFLSTLSGSDRQNYWEKLVEQFYEYFVDALGDQEAPYTLEQLKESYRLYFVTGGLGMLPMYGPVAETKLAYSNSEDVEEYREILTEKAERLLEDMERWHLYSKDVTKNHEDVEAEQN